LSNSWAERYQTCRPMPRPPKKSRTTEVESHTAARILNNSICLPYPHCQVQMRYKPMSMSLGLLIHSSCNGFFKARMLAAAAAFQLPHLSRRKRHQHGSAVSSFSLISSAAFQSCPTGRRLHSSRLHYSSLASTSSGTSRSGTDDPNADDDTTTRTNKEQQQVFFETTKTFADLGIQSDVLRRRIPFTYPTKVQSVTIPSIRQGTDVTIGAETGSGKVKKPPASNLFVLSLTTPKNNMDQ
jgi:hypothetical protein